MSELPAAASLAAELVRFESVSLSSNLPVIDFVERKLRQLGGELERIGYVDARGVEKASVIARFGQGTGGMAYFGHTDVVPAANWICDHGPFDPRVRDGRLYGRGSCDMKGSVACMLVAVERYLAERRPERPIYVVCTADEEIGSRGAAEVAQRSNLYRELTAGHAAGIIGEPTELDVVHAHKGGVIFQAVSRGRAAHSSTREGLNANWAMIPFLMEMKAIHDETESRPEWQNADFSPPTLSWNLIVSDQTAAVNITAPQSVCTVGMRTMPGVNVLPLLDRARRAADRQGLEFSILCEGSPLYTDPRSPFVREVLRLADRENSRVVAYGTDGFFLQAVKNLVVIGPGSVAQAHTHDEWIWLSQLEAGTDLYGRMLRHWCG